MPVSLSLYLYGLYQKKVQKDFDKKNKVLSQKKIEELLRDGDIQKTLQVFRSAVVDHKKVDGIPYYLSYPVNGIFYHDGFKRAVIADGITSYLRELQEEEVVNVKSILDKLIDPETSISYVQILAWNSLGRIGINCSTLVEDKKGTIMRAFGASVASVLGVLLFLDRMMGTTQQEISLTLIKEGKSFIKYRVQKALFNYYIFKSPHFGNPIEDNPNLENDIKRFLLTVQNKRLLTRSDTNEGLRYVGLVKRNQEASFWKNTPHAEVGKRMIKIANDYIALIGAFSRGEYY